jgi:hypothetical protein
MRRWLVLWGIVATGCQEYTLSDGAPVEGQANPAPLTNITQLDRIVQLNTPKVDVLWVLDNSSSMTEEANKVAQNFPVFIQWFLDSGLDWHVGIISTNLDRPDQNGRLQTVEMGAEEYRWIDRDTPNPIDIFNEMIPFYPGVSHQESGRQATYRALAEQVDTYNADFIRDDASLHIVMISDEDDHSIYPSVDEFVSWIINLRPDANDRSVSSIVGLNPCLGASEIGHDYIEITEAVGGELWSICESNWEPVLDALGERASSFQKQEFFLSDVPVASTLEVWVVEPSDLGGNTYTFNQGIDYQYIASRNSIQFETYIPYALSEVFIQYEILGAWNPGQVVDEDTAAP